jgi:hypothetical protein
VVFEEKYMRTRLLLVGMLGVSVALVSACGGGTAARGAAEPAPSGSAAPAARADQSAAATARPGGEAPKGEADELNKLYRSPRDALTRKDVSYMIAFNECDVGVKAAETCAKQANGDPQKRSKCMAAARSKLGMVGIRFGQDTAGDWYWITIDQKGNSLVAIHKIKFDFGDETEKTIAIIPKGRDLGTKPMRQIPSKIVFEMESDYRMTSTDPQHGKLVYDVKIGMPNQ